ncbi:16S rRNA (uracil(1498)-N(3))-methyltransferase [Algihabitans albus]|uniref:16S rRNA (uracil(1498)-N(3))-methyltransferase n=1 Tax=Algihabitans albus TaxID=2164067 RepID=UPI000E5D3E9D|nr:16S rRNA (uracil(1498)-N(3))-methyltransferase [Algihabitans albus]
MVRDKVATRLYVEDDLANGQIIGLDQGRAHFLRTVLRLKAGARVALFNGRHGEWSAVLEGLGKGWASLAIGDQRRVQVAEPDLWLVFAPIKRGRIDFLIEKATELGCSELHPAMTRFTAMDRVNTDRLAANAREAAEQCERLSVPQVRTPHDLDKLIAAWPAERHLLVCAERRDAAPIADSLADARTAGLVEQPWAVLIGPEGGFADHEFAALSRLPRARFVGLGPRILRADTAGIAALTCWQAWLGDWRHHPEVRSDL